MRFIAGRWMDDADFTPMGAPETIVEMPGEMTFGLRIPSPFGRATDAMLTVRANWETEVVTMAIGTVIERTPRPIMDMHLLSNPRRVVEEDTTDDP